MEKIWYYARHSSVKIQKDGEKVCNTQLIRVIKIEKYL